MNKVKRQLIMEQLNNIRKELKPLCYRLQNSRRLGDQSNANTISYALERIDLIERILMKVNGDENYSHIIK